MAVSSQVPLLPTCPGQGAAQPPSWNSQKVQMERALGKSFFLSAEGLGKGGSYNRQLFWQHLSYSSQIATEKPHTSPTEVSGELKEKLISHFPFLPCRTRKHLRSGLGNVGRTKQGSPLLAPAWKCRRCSNCPARVASVGRGASTLTRSQRAEKGGGRLGWLPPCCS